MGSFYNDASLVMIPSGYKDQKVYCAKPADGSGDLVFSRASSATRVASNGLIEKVRTNSILQSNTFSNVSWNKTNLGLGSAAVVTANYTTDPFGGNNGWRFQCNLNGGTTSSDRSWMLQTFTPFANNIISIYIKLNVAGSKTIVLSNGGGDVQTITSTDWVRISKVTASSIGEFRIGLIGGSTSDTLDCSIAFAQAETGDIATDYIETTTAAVSVGPVSGLPRLDYLNSTCPKLLLEPQRTNLAEYSEQFNNVYWGKTAGTTLTANTTISPSGYQDADSALFASSVDSINKVIATGISVVIGTSYTFSVFTKSLAQVVFFGGASTGTATNVYNGAVDYGNGWYRQSVTRTYSAAGTVQIQMVLTTSTASSSLIAYGFQAELGAYASSYIPTLAASVTRVADAASKTGISSLIGQTEGTLFCDIQWQVKPEAGSPVVGLLSINSAANLNNCIILGIERNSNGTNRFYSFVQVGGATVVSLIGSTLTNGRYKAAMAYKENDFVLYVNGVQIATDTSGAVPTNSVVIVGGRFVGDSVQAADPISQALVFKTRLTNSQLQELTTL